MSIKPSRASVLAMLLAPLVPVYATVAIANGKGTWNAAAGTATVVVSGTGGHTMLGHLQCLDKSNHTVEVALNTGTVTLAANGGAMNMNFALTAGQMATYTLAQNYHVYVQDTTDNPLTHADGYLDVNAVPANVISVGATIGLCSGPGFALADGEAPTLPPAAQLLLAAMLLMLVLVRANRT